MSQQESGLTCRQIRVMLFGGAGGSSCLVPDSTGRTRGCGSVRSSDWILESGEKRKDGGDLISFFLWHTHDT